MKSSYRNVILSALPVLMSVCNAVPVNADSSPTVNMRDDCQPATFNAKPPLGPGAASPLCKPSFNGNTSFVKFNAELGKDRKVGAWKYNPDQTQVTAGQPFEVENIGGEVHSFTRVQGFGGGIVPSLNFASGNPVAAPECIDPSSLATFVQSGAKLPNGVTIEQTDKGKIVRFQCCIHPWMRIEMKVQ